MNRKLPLGTAFRAATIFTLMSMSVNTRAQTHPSAAPAGSHGEVPVKEVVLFSSGVGYFQHEGSVQGDGQTELRFKTTQINDILKSLVLQDLDGGHVGVVTYPSQDPLAKTLGSFQVDISDNPSLGDLLNKLRGASVTLSYAGPNGVENFAGTVLGVEKREVPGGKEGAAAVEKSFLNLVTDQRGIRSLEMDRVDHLELNDPGLKDELNRALAAVAGARDQDKKPVEIHFNGPGERRVRLGYVVETPIWRASYRLVLPTIDPHAAKDAPKNAKGMLQGWALVENQSDNDWKDVKLSLVSGRPISFIQDLYQPLYVPRPTVVPELYASLRPQEYEGGQGGAVGRGGMDEEESARDALQSGAVGGVPLMKKAMEVRSRNVASSAPGLPAAAPAPEPEFNLARSVAPTTEAAKVGELFQYVVGNVSLARQRSAMIPIINDPVAVEKLSIYNESVLGNHPLNGARLKNDTEDNKHLLQGPVTVFDEGRYAGDARLDDVPPGQTRLLSYGIDLQTNVIAKALQDQQAIQSGKIVKGVLQLTRKFVSAKEYSTENKADHDKTVVLEYPVRQDWKLADTPAPVETTDKLYRFQMNVAAGKTEKFTVHEENVQSQNVSLLPTGLPQLQWYSQTGEISLPVRNALAKAVNLKQSVEQTQGDIRDRDAQVSAISDEQNRLRENIKTVDKTSAYATRLLKKLDDQESQIEKLRNDTSALRSKLDEQTRALAEYLNDLNVG